VSSRWEGVSLEIRNVSSGYGEAEVLHEISLILKKGEILVALGPNGAGKTTTLLTIMGFLHPQKGKLFLNGEDVSKLAVEGMAAKGVSLVPQGGRVFPTLSVGENLALGGYTLRTSREVEQGINSVYQLFPQLKERCWQRASTLSGGERQMLAMGRSLMANPNVLLLDEPTLGLAPITSQVLMSAISHIREASGTSILLVEQNAAVALPIADRAYVMTVGRLVFESDEPRSLLDRSKLLKLYMGDKL
jgi:branched-chain amino acid transport system ATP-binding protein